MPVTVVVGGQFGSEGKGKIAHYFAKTQQATIAVRTGGSNSGHTVIDLKGTPRILRQLPTAALLPATVCVMPPGMYIDEAILIEETRSTNLAPKRLVIDPFAGVVLAHHKAEEVRSGRRDRIGSTNSGLGAAVVNRVRREAMAFARDVPSLAPFLGDTLTLLRTGLHAGERILIEGTQGYGLSLLHSRMYPYTTSRDTTAAAFVAEAGLSPRDVDTVVMVIRAFPIRVPGNSGPLPDEITWEEVTDTAGSRLAIREFTSVTHGVRRVARFHPDIVSRAIAANNPDVVVLNHVDYIDVQSRGGELTPASVNFVEVVERQLHRRMDLLGTGADQLVERAHLRAPTVVSRLGRDA